MSLTGLPPFGLAAKRSPRARSFYVRGMRLSAKQLNDLAESNVDHGTQPVSQIVGQPLGKLIEAKIAWVVVTQADVQNEDQQDFFDQHPNGFLVMWPMRLVPGDYFADDGAPFFALPGGEQPIARFRGPAGEVIYTGAANQPVWLVGRTQIGNTLLFGHGMTLVDQPLPGELCL
jgi:hypothetical protein